MHKITCTLLLSLLTVLGAKAQTYYDTLTQTDCESYTWRGKTYTESGTYYDTVVLSIEDTLFNFTGGDQSFTVPVGTKLLAIGLYGAGGGVGHDDYRYIDGGSGGYVEGVLSVSPEDTLNVIVGEGGKSGLPEVPNDSSYGGGTEGFYINNGHHGGAGGGRSAIQIDSIDVVSAGGGGGGGTYYDWMKKVGGGGGSGPGPRSGGTGGGYPYDSTLESLLGAGGYSYVMDPLFILSKSDTGAANNAGVDSTVSVDGGHGKATITWVKDSVYVLNLTVPQPDLSVDLSENTLTSNEGTASYQWLDCDNNYAIIDGETAQSFTPVANGNYAVELTNNGCADTSDCVSVTTIGINEPGKNIAVSVYPNPTTGAVFLSLNENLSNVELEVTDLQGRTMTRKVFQELANTSIEMPETAGIYFLTITSEEVQNTIKLIKE